MGKIEVKNFGKQVNDEIVIALFTILLLYGSKDFRQQI